MSEIRKESVTLNKTVNDVTKIWRPHVAWSVLYDQVLLFEQFEYSKSKIFSSKFILLLTGMSHFICLQVSLRVGDENVHRFYHFLFFDTLLAKNRSISNTSQTQIKNLSLFG